MRSTSTKPILKSAAPAAPTMQASSVTASVAFRGLKTFSSQLACCSKYSSHRELDRLGRVARCLAQRQREHDLERAQRRYPVYAQTRRKADIGGIEFVPDVPHVNESAQSHRSIVLQPREREKQFRVGYEPLAAAPGAPQAVLGPYSI